MLIGCGSSLVHRSCANGQRGWNGQPDGMFSRSGGAPWIGVEPLRVHVGTWNRVHQAEGVRMRRMVIHIVDLAIFHDLAGVHHDDPVAHFGDHAEVVRDEDQAHAGVLLKLVQKLHDLCLHRDVERRRRLVGNQHVGVER